MSSCVELLRGAFAESCEALSRVLADIGDEEFIWEPVAGCWTVHPRSQVRAASADGRGEWVIDYEDWTGYARFGLRDRARPT